MSKHSFVYILLIMVTISGCKSDSKVTDPVVRPKFHVFFFCWTDEPEIGSCVKINLEKMTSKLMHLAKAINHEFIPHVITGNKYRMTNIKNEIENTKIGKNEIVIVYFSSHGGKSINDKSAFPQVDVPINDKIASYNIYKEIKDKSPKILLTIVEACSGFQNILPQQKFLSEYNNLAVQQINSDTALFNNVNLLFNSTCNLIVSAGQPGMNTWADLTAGSIFTNSLLTAIDEAVSSKDLNEINWASVLEKARLYTYDFTQTTSLKHFPVWELDNCSGMSKLDTSIVNLESNFKIKAKKNTQVPAFDAPYYNVELSVISSQPIDSVLYFNHYTQIVPQQTMKNKNENFKYVFLSQREYMVKAKIFYKSGKVERAYGIIKFN